MLRTEISSNIARTEQKENCGKHTLHTNRSVLSAVVPTNEHTALYCTQQIFRISFPTIITCAFMQLTYFINTIYAGKLQDAPLLAGLGLGTCLLESFTLYILIGMNGALETLTA